MEQQPPGGPTSTLAGVTRPLQSKRPVLLTLWIISSTKGQNMITDTLFPTLEGYLEKHVALEITLALITAFQSKQNSQTIRAIQLWFVSTQDYECQIRRIYLSAHFTSPNNLRLWGFGLMSFHRTGAANPFLWYLSEVELSTFLINFPLILSLGCDISEIWACGAQVRCSYADGGAFIAVLNEMWSVGLYM